MINMNNKLLPLCLLVVALGHAALSQDDTTEKNDSAKERAAFDATIQKAMEAARKRAAYEAMVKNSKEAHLPIVEEANFSIDITSKKNSFYGGEPVWVDITLKNNGGGNPWFSLDPVEDFYDIQVTGLYGVVDDSPSRFMRRFAGSIPGYYLRRGKDLSGSVALNNLFDMSLAGTYRIKVAKRFRLKNAKGEPVTITSNTLEVKVTSDAPISQWN